MEKWRLDQLEQIAYSFAVRAVKNGLPQRKNLVGPFIDEAIESSVANQRINNKIDCCEVAILGKLMRRQIEQVLKSRLGLEDGMSRFEVNPSPEKKSEKKEASKYSRLENDKTASIEQVYERAKDMVLFATKKKISLTIEEFNEKVEELMSTLKSDYPFFFDSKTGELLTTVQAAYLFPYDLDEKEKVVARGRGDSTSRYRRELFKLEEFLSKNVDRQIDKPMPKGLSNPITMGAGNAIESLQQEGVVLYLPEVYHGFSPSLAEYHYNEFLKDDFRLCDPLAGIMIANQNIESLNRSPMLSRRIQAYHLLKSGKGRDQQVFGMCVTPYDMGFIRISYLQAFSDISSGVIFDPKG